MAIPPTVERGRGSSARRRPAHRRVLSIRGLAPACCLALTAIVALAACAATDAGGARPGDPAIRRLFALVREAYSGDRALETVAFVESHWRIVGNAGFDASIDRVAAVLEGAGYVPEERAGPADRLVYRIEVRPMERPTWEPVDASLRIAGRAAALLEFATNRNMVAVRSFSTPDSGVEAEVVHVGRGRPEDFEGRDVAGRIVFGEAPVGALYREAVQARGAVGVLAYSMPSYTQPEKHRGSIQFGGIPHDPERQGWGLALSHAAREELKAALAAGPVRARVAVRTRVYPSAERTLVAEVRGSDAGDERFVFSAHVQEPGANDNASGVGALAEAARVAAELVGRGDVAPRRTITFLWGDEIVSTRRFVTEDSSRAAGIRWGMSLDMVGEDTEKTGGTFLIEKMPDPSAVWTRGEDRHSEWGGEPLPVERLTPHYFNDLVLNRCRDQAAATGWTVRTNPFEGGSDHVPFLEAGKPGLLLWHFTDVFYHTDGDRLDKVSPATLENAGVCALVTALTLVTASPETARFLIGELERAALDRLAAELELSRAAVAAGGDRDEEIRILRTWTDWYREAALSAVDIEVGGASEETRRAVEAAARRIEEAGSGSIGRLRSL